MNIRALDADEIEEVLPLLLLAEPVESALRWSLNHLSDCVYGIEIDGQWVGAANVRWQSEPCEIIEFAIAPEQQGRGLGKQLIAWLLEEAKTKGKEAVFVGTSNANIQAIYFYQRCGFRMDHVRADYFWYYHTPRIENRLQVRDLLVFRYDLAQDPTQDHAPNGH